MKKFLKYLPALLLVLLSTGAFAGVSNFDSVQTRPTSYDACAFSVQDGSGNVLWCIDSNGTASKAGGAGLERRLNLPLLGFSLGNATPTPTAYSDTALIMMPAYANASTMGYSTNMGWQTIGYSGSNYFYTPIVQQFRIPADYSSGGAFRVLANQGAITGFSPHYIGFDVWTLRAGRTLPATTMTQVQVGLNTTFSTSPQVVTLTPSGDTYFAAVAAGDWVKFRMWRAPSGTGQGALNIFAVDFYYTGKY